MNNGPYIRKISNSWWLQEGQLIRYMIRELTSLLIGLFAFVLIIGCMRLAQGAGDFAAFLHALWSPAGLTMSSIVFAFALFHSASWFNLTPKAMPIWIGAKRVPGWVIIAAHYAGWGVVSAVIFFLAAGAP